MVTISDFSQEPENTYLLIASMGVYWTLGSVCVCVCVALLKAVVETTDISDTMCFMYVN